MTKGFDRSDWRKWGERFGWELESADNQGAEFRIPDERQDQGYHFMNVTNYARRDLDRFFEWPSP